MFEKSNQYIEYAIKKDGIQPITKDSVRPSARAGVAEATTPLDKSVSQGNRLVNHPHCPTKIYLADETATSSIIAESYRQMDLTDDEIATIARGRKKRDYFYKSTEGCRLFQLGLDPLQLALLAPGKQVLDSLEEKYGKNSMKPLARQILDAKGFGEYRRYFAKGA